MNSINIDLGYTSYPIIFTDSFEQLSQSFAQQISSSNILIITDSNVEPLYYNEVFKALKTKDNRINKFIIPAGEKSKKLSTINKIYRRCLEVDLDRSSCIVALGGGVVGDIAGFAASTFMRGIKFVQIPTTLLSQVDSSVGGKTGVDFAGYKNIIGAFYQPSLVYINVQMLKTLPKREFIAGMAEVIKYGVIKNRELFNKLDQNSDKILNQDQEILIDIIKTCCQIKADIVVEDEREAGLRAILNFGHTIGHAIESASKFRLLHGECVAMGIIYASKLANKCNTLGSDEYNIIYKLILKYGLPTGMKRGKTKKVIENIKKDKKAVGGKIKFIMPKTIGEVIITDNISYDEISKVL